MSSYYPSFSYTSPNGVRYNSFKDKNLIVVHFESGDSGEVDTFLGMEPVYSDNAYGTRRFDYGARYKDVAVIRISVMKPNGEDFSVSEVRDFLRWTSGSRKITCLDLSDIIQDGDEIKEVVQYSFFGRITSIYQQKLDSRTVGFVIEHTSISPYAYSPVYTTMCSFKQVLSVDDDGALYDIRYNELPYDEEKDAVVSASVAFSVADSDVVHIDNSTHIRIKNETDDLSDYVYLDTIFNSDTSDHLIIKNKTLYDQSDSKDGLTEIAGVHNGETISLGSGQFITSSSGRMIGNDFNFVWPKLIPGDNHLIVGGSGEGSVGFTYRHPIKIGDCAIDFDMAYHGLCWELIK